MQVCLLVRAVSALLFYCGIAIWLAPLGFPLVFQVVSVSAARLSPTLGPERRGLLLGRLLCPGNWEPQMHAYSQEALQVLTAAVRVWCTNYEVVIQIVDKATVAHSCVVGSIGGLQQTG